jgi:sRNA-binding protein
LINYSLELEMLPILTKAFPRAFFARGKTCKPLRCGIFDDLDAALPAEINRDKLKQYLRLYTSASRYLREIVAGSARITLNGEVAGSVSEQEAQQAQEKWQRIYGRKIMPLVAMTPPPASVSPETMAAGLDALISRLPTPLLCQR